MSLPVMSGGQRVLVIKLGALGDVALSTPLLARILEAHAADEVTLLTAPAWVDLFSAFPRVQLVAYRRKGGIEMLRVMRWLLGQSFDVVYDLQGSLRSRIMTLLTQAQKRAGPVPALAYTHTPPVGNQGPHAFDRFNAVLQAAGLEAAQPVSQLPLGTAAATRVDAWLQQQDLGSRRLVLMHAGASPHWPSKRWPEPYFLQLAQALENCGLAVVWLGGETEAELNRRLARHAGVDATAVFSLGELAALARRASFAMSNDSGPMHLLATAGLPVYAFFGPTDWQRSHALGQSARVLVTPVPCSPCHLQVCPPQRQHVCLAGITPEIVLARLEADGMLPQARKN